MSAKTDYKTTILDYLKNHTNEDVSRALIRGMTGISKSRLTEIINSIRRDGYTVISPPRSGYIRLEADASTALAPEIKDRDIRQWLIILLLSKYEKLKFIELLSHLLSMYDIAYEHSGILTDYDNNANPYDDNSLIKTLRKNSYGICDLDGVAHSLISVTALRNDLKDLREQGIVVMSRGKQTDYRLSSKATLLVHISSNSLYNFVDEYTVPSGDDIAGALYRKMYRLISNLMVYYGNDSDTPDAIEKDSDISPEQTSIFKQFTQYPYATNVIELSTDFNGTIYTDLFAVGLVFYSVEADGFYILGKNINDNRIECKRLDRIDDITATETLHKEYHADKYYSHYTEMFSTQYHPSPYRVKVAFTNYGNTFKRFSDLKNVRPKAGIRKITDKPQECIYDYVYEDTVRDLDSFAKYLGWFGWSVLALEPPELKERMIESYKKIIEKHGEIND